MQEVTHAAEGLKQEQLVCNWLRTDAHIICTPFGGRSRPDIYTLCVTVLWHNDQGLNNAVFEPVLTNPSWTDRPQLHLKQHVSCAL